MLERLGAWAARRPQPRLWISIAGAGCLMAVSGLLAIAGDAQVEDSGEAGSTTPGIIIFLLVVLAGYLLMQFLRETPAATAGSTAVVLGMPLLAWFLTFDESAAEPFSLEAILGLPALVWIVSYFVGPGRGRPLLLATGLIFGWLFALQVVEDPTNAGSLSPPLLEDDAFGAPFDEGYDDYGYDDEFNDYEGEFDQYGYDEPSWTTLGAVSLVFGAGYLVATRLLDRRGHAGTATSFVVAGHIALPVGLAYLADTLEVAGTGVAFAIAGALIAWLGAVGGRRLTTIVGALEMIFGLYLVVGDAMNESTPTNIGVALFVLGGVIVGVAHLLHLVTGETPQTTPGPSRFAGRPSPGSGGPWGPGADGRYTAGAPTFGGPGPGGPYAPAGPGAPGPGAGGPYSAGGPGAPGSGAGTGSAYPPAGPGTPGPGGAATGGPGPGAGTGGAYPPAGPGAPGSGGTAAGGTTGGPHGPGRAGPPPPPPPPPPGGSAF
ncbi:MAG TPA: hypothetical protein VFY82_02005 [Acidimicrobiales bacterium]|nr:hypothetical protein [Acidimicrobiales bacterium]